MPWASDKESPRAVEPECPGPCFVSYMNMTANARGFVAVLSSLFYLRLNFPDIPVPTR